MISTFVGLTTTAGLTLRGEFQTRLLSAGDIVPDLFFKDFDLLTQISGGRSSWQNKAQPSRLGDQALHERMKVE